jgi:hypothetical protein
MDSNSIDNLRADASRILANSDTCWSAGVAVRHVADVLVRIHPGINRELAIVAAEQARWSGWP